jgi:MFS family permease
MTERPTGLIFAFGVAIGIVVGIVIAYQVLSADVADHIREYATFKAMGFRQGFFIGIILEEAIILAAIGFWPGLAFSAAVLPVAGLSDEHPDLHDAGARRRGLHRHDPCLRGVRRPGHAQTRRRRAGRPVLRRP